MSADDLHPVAPSTTRSTVEGARGEACPSPLQLHFFTSQNP